MHDGQPKKKITLFFLCLFVLLFPLLEAYSNTYIPIGTKYFGFFIVYIWALESLAQRRVRLTYSVVLLIFFVLMNAASVWWSADAVASSKRVIGYVQVFILYFLIVDVIRTRDMLIRLMSCYVIGTAILSVSAFVNVFSGTDYSGYGVSGRFSAAGYDPNDFGIVIASTIPIAYFLFVEKKSKLSLLYILLIIPVAISTASRGAILALSIVVIGYTLIFLKSVKKTVLLILATAVVVWLIPYFVPNDSLIRLTTSMEDVTGSGRSDFWALAWQLGSSSPFIGNGSGTFAYLNPAGKQAHNTFLSIWSDLGIIGISFWLTFWILHFKKVVSVKPLHLNDNVLKIALFLSLAALLIGALTLNWEIRKQIFIIWGLIVVYHKMSKPIPVTSQVQQQSHRTVKLFNTDKVGYTPQ